MSRYWSTCRDISPVSKSAQAPYLHLLTTLAKSAQVPFTNFIPYLPQECIIICVTVYCRLEIKKAVVSNWSTCLALKSTQKEHFISVKARHSSYAFKMNWIMIHNKNMWPFSGQWVFLLLRERLFSHWFLHLTFESQLFQEIKFINKT